MKKPVSTPKTDELIYKLMGQIDMHRKTNRLSYDTMQSVYEAFWELAKHTRELERKLGGICAKQQRT